MRQKKSRGRPPRYVIGNDGRPIVGLSYDQANNRYFNTHWKSDNIQKEHFGNNKEEAIFLFRQWEAQIKGEKHHGIEKDRTKKSIRVIVSDDFLKKSNESDENYKLRVTELNQKLRKGEIGSQTSSLITIPESFIYAKARELILNDITDARKKLNLPIELKGTFKTEKSITLPEIENIYFNQKRKPMSKGYKKDGLRFWSEFKTVVNVRMVSQITEKHIEAYEDWVYEKSKQKKWANSTINNRLLLVATVFNQASKDRRLNQFDKMHLKTVREFCNFRYADTPEYDPNPITKEDFLKILETTKDKIYRAIMLTALNCGMKETELADIRLKPRKGRNITDIDLNKNILSKPRRKTGIISVAILWDRTVEAIQLMLNEFENNTEYLFLNNNGNPIKPRNIRKWWLRERRRAGVSDNVKFEHIRDATQTIPVDHDSSLLFETKLLMGHEIEGVTNNYLQRRPTMVRNTCKVLEDYYFGNQKYDAKQK